MKEKRQYRIMSQVFPRNERANGGLASKLWPKATRRHYFLASEYKSIDCHAIICIIFYFQAQMMID